MRLFLTLLVLAGGDAPGPERRITCSQVRCRGGTTCVDGPSGARCVPDDPCAALACPSGKTCVVVKDSPPRARCVPATPPCARMRCGAQEVCVETGGQGRCQARVICGGLIGRPCPGAGQCVDDPSDSCDPAKGGRDCSGVCQCSGAAVLCGPGTRFDADPAVCACVR